MTSSEGSVEKQRKNILGISWFEWILVLLFFSSLFLVLAKFAGGPQVSDDFFYLDAGLNGYKEPMVLFYYAHIYFQRIFMEFASSPLAAGKYYWSFIITITSLAIYISSRVLNRNSRWLNASLATAIFLSLNFLSKYSGVNKNDLTAMMIVTLIVTVLIIASEDEFRNKILLGLLGFLFLFACKSKETALLEGFLFLGFGFTESQRFSFKKLLGRIPAFLGGFIAGVAIFALLNQWILKDAFWGLRLSDFSAYLGITGHNMSFLPFEDNFLSGATLKNIVVPFFLYLIYGMIQREENFNKSKILVWTFPLVLVGFLSLALVFASGFTVTDRFFFPAVPVMCIFASQVLPFDSIHKRHDWVVLVITLIIGLVLSAVLLNVMITTTAITGFKLEDLTINLLQPVFLSIFLISYAWKKPNGIRSMIVPVLCVTVLIFQPLYLNFHSILIDQPNNKRTSQLLYPLSAFSKNIKDFTGAVFYISPSLNKENQMLSRDTDEIRSMFDVYFHQKMPLDSFINPTINDSSEGILIYPDPLETLPKMNFRYAFITMSDWKRIRQDSRLFEMLNTSYDITFDDQGYIGLLSKKVK
jgi:hypothetical protein